MSEPTEYHCYLAAQDGLAKASSALRSLALLRADGRWLIPVRLLDELTERLAKMKDQAGQKPILWLPPRS